MFSLLFWYFDLCWVWFVDLGLLLLFTCVIGWMFGVLYLELGCLALWVGGLALLAALLFPCFEFWCFYVCVLLVCCLVWWVCFVNLFVDCLTGYPFCYLWRCLAACLLLLFC